MWREEQLNSGNEHLEVKRMKHLLAAGSASVTLRWMCKCVLKHNLCFHKVPCTMKVSGQTVRDKVTFSHSRWHLLPPLLDIFTLIVSSSLCFYLRGNWVLMFFLKSCRFRLIVGLTFVIKRNKETSFFESGTPFHLDTPSFIMVTAKRVCSWRMKMWVSVENSAAWLPQPANRRYSAWKYLN